MPIPDITAFGGQLPDELDPATFPARADALFLWIVQNMSPEMNTAIAGINAALNTDETVLDALTTLQTEFHRQGTWIPVLEGGVLGDARDMTGIHEGQWTRTGRRVHFETRNFKLLAGTNGLWQAFTITNMPFAISATSASSFVGERLGGSGSGDQATMSGIVLTGTLKGETFDAASDMMFRGSYLTDDP